MLPSIAVAACFKPSQAKSNSNPSLTVSSRTSSSPSSRKSTEQARWPSTSKKHMLYSSIAILLPIAFYNKIDHNIKRWMDTSLDLKFMCWRAHLSFFIFLICNIPGTQNGFAD